MRILMIFLILFISGCATKKFININTSAKPVYNTKKYIGLEEVNLPLYINDLELMKLQNNEFKETHVYLSKNIDSIIINLLSNKLNDPFIYKYPFEFDKKPDVILKVDITDFYIKNKKIFLNAKIYIKNKKNIKFFKINLTQKCKNNYNCVSQIFDKLTGIIAKEIKSEN